MKILLFIGLVGVVLAYSRTRSADRRRLVRWEAGQNWRRLCGMVAAVAVVFILLNPELAALGLLGDAAFFDLLVLALSVQMQMLALQVWRSLGQVPATGVRWVRLHSPMLSCLIAMSALTLGHAISSIQKSLGRLIT